MAPSKFSRKGKEKVDKIRQRPQKTLRIHLRQAVSPSVAKISPTTKESIPALSGFAFCQTPSITRATVKTRPSHNIGSLPMFGNDHELNDDQPAESQPNEGHVNDLSRDVSRHTHDSEGGEAEEETESEVDLYNKVWLRPDGEKAFLPSYYGAKKITKTVKARYNQFWESWSKIPEATRKMWFLREWKKYVDWDPMHDDHMWVAFNHIGARMLSDNFTRLRKSKRRPRWIAETIWAQILDYWASPAFVEVSCRNKLNHATNMGANVGTCLNTTASISMGQHKLKITQELGREPIIEELYWRTHMKKGDQNQDVWVSDVAQENHDKFMQLRAVPSSVCSCGVDGGATPSGTDRELWVEAVGVNRRGRIHSRSQTSTYDRVQSSRESRVTHVPTHVINEMELLEQRIQEGIQAELLKQSLEERVKEGIQAELLKQSLEERVKAKLDQIFEERVEQEFQRRLQQQKSQMENEIIRLTNEIKQMKEVVMTMNKSNKSGKGKKKKTRAIDS